ncbi:MAG: TIGR04282 family arsenosugar biosynthesis glycosyltransferase [Candidatus Nitrotoga sp.]
MKTTRILIFAKAPLAGFAKTRLIPVLGAEGAAALAQQMLLHTVQAALDSGVGTVELCVTPAIEEAAWHDIALPQGLVISAQGSGDLGARMARAAQCAIAGGERVVLIGTDCVEMSGELLRTAAQALHNNDAVIHCTLDGGYALLGLRQFSDFLFRDIPWSSDVVASMTLNKLGQLHWSVQVGAILHDVDEPQDLKLLPLYWKSYVAA